MSLALQSIHVFPQQRSRTSGFPHRRTLNAVNFVKLNKNFHTKNHRTPHMCLVAEHGGNHLACGVGEKDGIIIVDHGSRRKESNLMLNEFISMFKEKTRYPIVEPAHMELAEPSMRDAFHLCVQQGANRIIISPFFLFPGRHWNQDIPKLAHDAAMDFPGVSYLVTAPLGLHSLLVDVVNYRINYCLNHASGSEDECSVCAGTGKCHFTSSS